MAARRTEEMRSSLAELKQLQSEHGDAGIAAFMLGVPVEDVLRVTGPSMCPSCQDAASRRLAGGELLRVVPELHLGREN